jgi:hypothetical protein
MAKLHEQNKNEEEVTTPNVVMDADDNSYQRFLPDQQKKPLPHAWSARQGLCLNRLYASRQTCSGGRQVLKLTDGTPAVKHPNEKNFETLASSPVNDERPLPSLLGRASDFALQRRCAQKVFLPLPRRRRPQAARQRKEEKGAAAGALVHNRRPTETSSAEAKCKSPGDDAKVSEFPRNQRILKLQQMLIGAARLHETPRTEQARLLHVYSS